MPLITKETAREMGARGNQIRWAAEIEAAKQALTPVIAETLPDGYLKDQRDAVRARMKRYETLMDAETDPSALDRLTSAWSRLAEQERILDGRPLPGSRRPTADRSVK